VCGTVFTPRVSYQLEKRPDGTIARAFCSLPCKAGASSGAVNCDVCGKSFTVTFAYQALRTPTGAILHVCSEACRAQRVKPRVTTTIPTAAVTAATSDAPPTAATPASAQAPQTVIPTAVASAPLRATPGVTTSNKPFDGVRYKLAVLNQKGGTGKTTTSISVAAGLAEAGARVLLVDADPQGNVAASLGVRSHHTLYHVLMDEMDVEKVAVPMGENFDVLTSDDSLAAAEIKLAQHPARGAVLSRRLERAKDYTHIVIDCGPSLSLINQNALCFVDEVLIPVGCDYLSLVGVKQVLKTIKNVNQHLGHPLRVGGVLPTFYDGRAKVCRDAVDALRKHFGPLCMAPIRQNTKLKEAPSHKKTIFEHDPHSNGAEDYRAVVQYMIARSLMAPSLTQPIGSSAQELSESDVASGMSSRTRA
jgi:chromosome partitioning protein